MKLWSGLVVVGEVVYKYALGMRAKSLQQCLTPYDCSPPGSSVHGILQARILEWSAMPSSRGSSWPRDRTCVSYDSWIRRRVFFTTSTIWEAGHLGNRKTFLGNLNNTYESKTSIKSLKTPLRKMHFGFPVDPKVCLTHFLIIICSVTTFWYSLYLVAGMSIAKQLLETFVPAFSLFFLSMTENANCSLC